MRDKLHAQLDRLVLEAYGFTNAETLLEPLLALNLELAEREKQGLPMIGASHHRDRPIAPVESIKKP